MNNATAALWVQGVCYLLMGAIPPMTTMLLSKDPLDTRQLCAMILLGLGGGAVSLKAFLSTTFTDYKDVKNKEDKQDLKDKIATLQ